VSGAWYVPSVFEIRILGVFPLEEIAWSFLFFYLILAVYNAIYRKNFDSTISSKNNLHLLWISVISGLLFFAILVFEKQWLVMNHFYPWMLFGVMVLPPAVVVGFRPYVLKRTLLLAVAFGVFFLLFYEYSALKTGQWMFGGDYVGWIRLFDVRFPLEELLFAFLAVPGAVAMYEFFSDGKGGVQD
jgi:hypothetical protein